MPEFTEIDGVCLHYSYRPGTGGAVVFANSLGTDFRIWDAVIAGLPSDIPVLCFDKRGHGLSALGPITIERLADDLAALMDKHDLKDALVCGVSVGGLIAQSIAARRPDLVSSAVMMCTGMKIGNPEMWNPRIQAVRADGIASISEAILERWFSPGFRTTRLTELAGYRAMLTRTLTEGYAQTSEAIRDTDLTSAAPRLTLPTICVAGSEDGATPPALVRALADALPNAEYLEIEGAGHLPCIETPDRIIAAIEKLRAV